MQQGRGRVVACFADRPGNGSDALAAVREAPATHPVVTLIQAKQGEPTSELLLPGNIEPLYSASLYARIDGYLDRRDVDIGAKVKAGQILAVISAPEVDQQLLQSRATLAQSEAALQQARAALEQAKANATRPVSIRLQVADIERAKNIASEKGGRSERDGEPRERLPAATDAGVRTHRRTV